MKGHKSAARSVLFLISNLGLGGAERQLVYLALGLRARGRSVDIVSFSPLVEPSFEKLLSDAGIPVHVVQQEMAANIRTLRRAIIGVDRLIRALRPAALVGFMPHGALFARLLGRWRRVPKVVTSLRNIKSTHRWHDVLLSLTRGMDDGCVTNSAIAAQAQLSAGVTTRAKSIVIHNGLDLSRIPLTDSCVATAKIPTPFTWLNIAVFRHEKDHATLFAAVRELARDRAFKLQLAGEGPLLDHMKQHAIQLGIADRVEFLGWQRRIDGLLRAADGFVLSSLWEGLPNALIEAIAAGLPAVTTDVGGCTEIVEHGVSGLVIPPGDVRSLVEAMAHVMDMSVEERANMGRAGCRYARSGFSMEQMVGKWDELLQRI